MNYYYMYLLLCVFSGEKPYVCTVQGCSKRFTEYSSLYKHHVVHTHSKPYTCSYCGKNYRQTSTLAMHKRTAHGEGEDCTAESEERIFLQKGKGNLSPTLCVGDVLFSSLRLCFFLAFFLSFFLSLSDYSTRPHISISFCRHWKIVKYESSSVLWDILHIMRQFLGL
jgi:hypothetical protein